MAIFHMRMKSCARLNTPSKGPRSAISHASYISGQALTDHEYGDRFDTRASRHKEEVAHAEILAPVGAPGWVRDREMLWNRVHRAETRVNSRFARTLDVALPRELSEDAQLALARAYLHDEFVERGMVVDFAIHRDADGRNPHIHAMMTLRELEPEGFGKKRREWNARSLLHGWRRQWTEYANQTLAREGHDARIDHRSYQERGIELTGQKKLLCGQHVVVDEEHGARIEGVEGREMNARMLERLEEFREVAHRNGERICADPSIVLRAVSGNQAVFSKSEITRFIANHTDGAEQFQQALGIVMASPELVRLPGEQERYSTR
jgi:ATP-dependent exoDNAse (exonuclease V) alpha subunit